MIANLTRGAKSASIHLPAERRQIAGVLSYLGIDYFDEYALPSIGQNSSGILVSLEPIGTAERNIVELCRNDGISLGRLNAGFHQLLSLPYEQQLAVMDRIANERPEHFEDFQNILGEAVVPSVKQKFYCPLTVNLYTADSWGCYDDDPEEYDGRFAARYADMKIAVILTAYYGLRRSEVLGLKWDAIDPVEEKIYIRHKIIENKLNGNEIEGLDVMKTKSSYRSLPLMPFIKKALEEEKARQEEMRRVLRKSYNKQYLDYVCVDAVGNILKPQYVSEHFKVILERNGLKKIRFHDLRHSCASLMLANDISMKEIQEWLGHSNISTTANIYAHVDSESKRKSAGIIDKVLSQEG